MALNQKKFLDSAGLTYFAQLLNNYPDNEVLASVIDAISDALDEKADESQLSNYLTDVEVNSVSVVNGNIAEIDLTDTKVFLVTITQNGDDYISDKTAEEIVNAHNAGRTVIANDIPNGGWFLSLAHVEEEHDSNMDYYSVAFRHVDAWTDSPMGFSSDHIDIETYNGVTTVTNYTHDIAFIASNDHAHGNITNGGDITTTTTIANGDRLVINDESASKVTNSSITFGTSASQYLANNGTWQNIPTKVSDLTNDSGFLTNYTDTKNTAGSTDSSSKLFLIGATTQAANPQTYSHDTAYIGTDGCLYSGGAKTLVNNYSAGEYTYLNFTTNVVENQNDYALATFDLQASSFDGNLYSVLNYFIGSHDFSIQSQTLEKTFIQINNYSDSNFGDNNVGIYNLRTPTADADAANKKYVDDAIANKITLADLPIYDGTVV